MKTLRMILIVSVTLVSFALIAYVAVFYLGTVKGDGNVIVKDIPVSGFKAIEIKGMFEVIMKQSDTESVKIMADENLFKHISITNKENTLIIKNNRNFRSFTDLKIFITFIDINSIELKGAVKLTGKDTIKARDLEIDMEGAGKLKMLLNVSKLDIEISGAGDAVMSGYAYANDLEMSGASSFDGENLETSKTKVEVNGAANVFVFARDLLDVKISGAAEVKYKGEPALKQEISGVGKIKSVN